MPDLCCIFSNKVAIYILDYIALTKMLKYGDKKGIFDHAFVLSLPSVLLMKYSMNLKFDFRHKLRNNVFLPFKVKLKIKLQILSSIKNLDHSFEL